MTTKNYKQPLQVISVDLQSNEVKVNKPALQEISDNLKAAKVEKISVVSVMGAYRTGKSFLLDLFLRYLESEEKERLAAQQAGNNGLGNSNSNFEAGLDGGESYAATVRGVDERSNGKDYVVPKWMKEGGPMSETESSSTSSAGTSGHGFSWRGGASRCTEGMWIWPKPFLKTITVTENISQNEDEEIYAKKKIKVGLLLMDTQGAFDSQTTKQQSATIFGLTTALSSKQLYNIQGRIGSDTVDHLHYFSEMAVAATRSAGSASGKSGGKKPEQPFQFLQLVVRDWPSFDDETWDDAENCSKFNVIPPKKENQRWTVQQCLDQMRWHLDQHFGSGVKDRESVDTLSDMFKEVSCFLFPAPGLKVSESKKRKWDGSLQDIDEDFVRFIDLFCKDQVFKDVKVNKVLGGDLSPDSFVQVVETLVEAFSGMEVSQMSMVDAISKAKNLVAKDESEREYKKYMDKVLSVYSAKAGKKPEELIKDHEISKAKALMHFDLTANFGDSNEIENSRGLLVGALDEHWESYKKENDRRLEKALHAFAGLACLAVLAFVIDKLSDFTCDWWSDTCVQLSKMLVLVYTIVIGILIYQVYNLFQKRGHTASSLAVIELFKQMVVIATESGNKVVFYAQNIDTLKSDAEGFYTHANENYIKPMTNAVADLLAPVDVDSSDSRGSSSPTSRGADKKTDKDRAQSSSRTTSTPKKIEMTNVTTSSTNNSGSSREKSRTPDKKNSPRRRNEKEERQSAS